MTAPSDSNSPPSRSGDRSERPRDAATLILIDRSTGSPRALMGKRRADQVFMPNKFVFPGGRVDRADAKAPSADELRATETAKLLLDLRGAAGLSIPRTLALAAVRETYEETGLLVGARQTPARIPEAGPWRNFLGHGVLPRLSALTFLARAITPPGRPRRYDTRFFMAEASEIALHLPGTDGELTRLEWFTLDEMRALDLPGITRVIIEDLADRLKDGPEGKNGAGDGAQDAPVPFYFHRSGSFHRLTLSCDGATEHPAFEIDD